MVQTVRGLCQTAEGAFRHGMKSFHFTVITGVLSSPGKRLSTSPQQFSVPQSPESHFAGRRRELLGAEGEISHEAGDIL